MNLGKILARLRLRAKRYGASRSDKIAFWRERLRADYLAAAYEPEQVKKSILLADTFRDHCGQVRTVHELGVGSGRNIQHIHRDRSDVRFSGNDLDRGRCLKFMDAKVAGFLELVEQDTLSFLRERVDRDEGVDCVIVADHLIHIPPESIDEILDLMTRFARHYILFHEGVTRRPERGDDFWFLHNYDRLTENFDISCRASEPSCFRGVRAQALCAQVGSLMGAVLEREPGSGGICPGRPADSPLL